MKKSEREDLTNKVGLIKGNQITPNIVDRTKLVVKRYFDDKGFKNADIEVLQEQDPEHDDQMVVRINVDKKEKVKVNEITVVGNQVLKTKKIKALMKKTNEKGKLKNFFKTKKFIDEKYEEDKERIIEKYNELGYRDATIVVDSVTPFDENTVNVYLEIEEGQKYFIRDITWLGNTVLIYRKLLLQQRLRVLQRGPGGNQHRERLRGPGDAYHRGTAGYHQPCANHR